MTATERTAFPVSVSMTAAEQARINSRIDVNEQESRSNRILGDLNIFWALMDIGLESVRRKLSRGEALLLLDALNSTFIGFSRHDARSTTHTWANGFTLASTIEDAIQIDMLDDKWYVDGAALLKKLKRLSALEIISVLDWVKSTWRRHSQLGPESTVFDDEVRVFTGGRDHTRFEQFLHKQTKILNNPAATLPEKEQALGLLKLATDDLQDSIRQTRAKLMDRLIAGEGRPEVPLKILTDANPEDGDIGSLYFIDRMRTLIQEQGATPEEAILQLLKDPALED